MNSKVHSETYRITWQDTDAKGLLSISALTRVLQESAWRHAGLLGFGFEYLAGHNAIWVMFKLHIQITDWPRWDENITIRTWPGKLKGIVASREFVVEDQSGKRLGAASSDWLVIGREDRKPRKTGLLEQFMPHTHEDVIPPVQALTPSREIKTMFLDTHRVGYSEIDLHQHANTSRYFEWVIDALPDSLIRKNIINHFSMHFVSECSMGDEIELVGNLTGTVLQVHGLRNNDKKVVFETAFTMQAL
ncbi:MAG: hypothetical protein KKD74_01055 [Bacteroidetes bacterium]|nr:hypothetical protein [Bacteroidota bacterium]